MSSNIIHPFGGLEIDITIPAGESIAVYTKGTAQVYQLVGYPNVPATKSLNSSVMSGQSVIGPFTDGATLQIEAGASEVLYQVGVSPVVTELKGQRLQPDPGVLNATGALTAAMIFAGIVTSTTAAGVAATVPNGPTMDAAGEFAIGDSFDWSVINTGGNAFTVTAAAGHTLVGAAATAGGTSGVYRTRKTATSTFITYRIG
jgi:hypothetical protein